jgi:integrase
LAGIKARVGPATYDRYALDVHQHLLPRLGRLQLGHLTAFHVAQLFRDMAAAGSTADAQRKAGTVLRQALRYAESLNLIRGNPALKVPLPRVTRAEIRVLTPPEVARFLAAADGDRLFALYVLALDSGMRQGELFALTWSDLDEERHEVEVTRSLSEVRGVHRVKETKTRKGRRRIPLSATAWAELCRHRDRMRAEGHGSLLVFPTSGGTFSRKSNVVRRHFHPAVERAGLAGVRFHDLRHTCATLLLLNNVNVKVVSERLGHASIEITLNTYSHVLPTMQQQAASVMEGILSNAMPVP